MDLSKLLELNAEYKAAVRKATEDTVRALEEIDRYGPSFERMAALEAAMAHLAETNERRELMARCRGQGFGAGECGYGKEKCEYEEGSAEQLFWYKGWCQAKNLMPFTEVPMEELFEMDRVVRRFCSSTRSINLVEAISMRLFQQSGKPGKWSDLHPYAQKHFRVMAVEFLAGIMQVDDVSNNALPAPSLPQTVIPGNVG